MSWKRGDTKSPKDEESKKDGELTKKGQTKEESADDVLDILEVNDSEFIDEEALLQGGAEDDDIDEGTNDDLLEGDVIGETRSARQNDAVEVADVGRCQSYALPGTVQELSVSAGQVDNDKAKIEQGQPDGSGKRKGAQCCEDKSSATLGVGLQSGDSVAATAYAAPASRKQDTSSKKTSALESSSVLAASNKPGQSSHGNARHVTSDKDETSGNAGRDISPSRSRMASRGGRLSKRTDRANRAALCSNGPQQSRCDSRFAHRRPYSRGHSASHAKQRHMPYAARPSTSMSSPSRPPFGTSLPYRPASFGRPYAEQPHMAYAVRSSFGTSPPSRPADSCNRSQANLQDLLHVVMGTTVGVSKRTPEIPAIETHSTLVGPVLTSTGLGSGSPGLAASGAPLQPPLSRKRWPLPDDRAGVHNSPFLAASQQHDDSKEAAVRRGAATGDGGSSLPNFSPQRPSRNSNEAAEQQAYLCNNDISQRRLPSCEPRYKVGLPSSETLKESASKSGVGHNETSKDIFPASKDFPSLKYAPRAPGDVDVPKMHIDYNHGNGDCDYRIPEYLRKAATAIGEGRQDLSKPSDREEWPSARLGELSQDGNPNVCRRLERCDAVHAGSKRHNPSGTRARSTISGTQSFDDPGSTYDDVKRARIVGSNGATSLQPAATSAARNVATDPSPTQVARFSKNSTSNQALSLTETFSDDAPIEISELRSPNSDEYDKRLQEQLLLRKEIMRRKEEQRRQEAERRRIEMEKSRENNDSLTPYDAGRHKPDASKAEHMPRRSANSLQSLLPAGLAEPPFRVPTLEVSANIDGTAGAAGSIAVTVASRATTVAVKESSCNSASGAKAMRLPAAPVRTASSGNRLLRERYRHLQLVAGQRKPVSNAAQSTSSAPTSPHCVRGISSLSVGGSTGSSAPPKSPLLVSSTCTLSDGDSAGSSAASQSPQILNDIRTLSDGDNAGSAAVLRASRVLPGNRRQFGAGEPMSPSSEPATFGPPAGHRREDLRARPQPQWPQQQDRHMPAVDSRSPNQSGWLLVDYGRDSTESRHAGLSSRRSKKVRIHNVSPNSARIPLLLAAATCGKVVDMHFDGTRSAIVEFDTVAAAELFFNRYNNCALDGAKISVNIELS